MKYLFNSLQSYESGHGDALCPIQDKPDKSFMGDHKSLKLVTNEDLRLFSSSLFDTLKIMLGSQPIMHPFMGTSMSLAAQHPSLTLLGASEPAPIITSGHHVTSPATPSPTSSSDMNPNQPPLTKQRLSQQHMAPVPGAMIPDIPQGPNAWKVAIQQWDGFLRDWEPHTSIRGQCTW